MNYKKLFIMLLITTMFLPLISATTDFDVVNLSAKTYNYKPSPVIPGEEFDIWIQLTNNSNTVAKNVSYFIEPKYPFILSDFNNTEVVVPTIAPYQSIIIKYTLKTDFEALDGTYELTFKYKKSEVNIYSIEKYNIDVLSDNAILDLINTDVSKLAIGSEGKIKLHLKNLGSKDVKNIFVSLNDSEDIKVVSLKTIFHDNLKTKDELVLSYDLSVSKSANKKSYTLPIEIKYSDNSKDYTINRNVSVLLSDEPNLVINTTSVGHKHNTFLIGGKERVSVEIYNVGNVDAESVYVELNTNIAEINPKYFIGSIEKDNYDNVSLDFTLKQNLKPGAYPLEIIVNYKDSSLKQKSIKKTMNVDLVSRNGSGFSLKGIFNTILSIVLFIVGLALLVLFCKWAKRKIIIPAFGGFFKNVKDKKKKIIKKSKK